MFKSYDELKKNFKINVPEFYNFAYDVIDKHAEEDRNRLALVWTNQDGEEKKFTFLDLKNLSNMAANIMIKYNVRKGDKILIMLPRIPDWWIFVLSLVKLGAVFCPVPTLLTKKDLEYRINLGKFETVITNEEFAHLFDEIDADCPSLKKKILNKGDRDGWINFEHEIYYPAPVSHTRVTEKVVTKAEDPMLIYFTSGTSGYPKMVLHNYAYPLGHEITARLWHGLTKNDLHFTVSDTGWAKCSWGKIWGQWIVGAAIFVFDYRHKFSATELLPLLEKYEITSFCAPPTIYRMMVLADLKKYDLHALKHCCSAGEAIHPETMKVWKEGTGLDIYEGYGQSETVCMIAHFPGMKIKQGSMGKPSPLWDVELLDDDGTPVKDGEQGRIAVNLTNRPVGLLVKYVSDEKANSESFQNGYYFTGDKAYKDEDGYFWFVGRNDDVIKSSGYRIGPFEVESTILEHPSVKEVAVIGVPDTIRGIVIKAFIVLKSGWEASDILTKEIQTYVKETTAPYKYPRVIEYVDELPKTHSGKIKRNVLREMSENKSEDLK